ncbi:MAG: GDSL-like Lipase/Acylhydrolase, partial [Planctomycetaceae bacterium]|nr:GDSL-like Lipase/Acylhydrolase [Planctomycetaceae bacterium]
MTPSSLFASLILLFLGFQPQASMLQEPIPYQVTQRVDFQPLNAHEHAQGGPQLGSAAVLTKGEFPAIQGETFEYRTALLNDAFGKAVDWTPYKPVRDANSVAGNVRIPAGGWYRLEIRQRVAGETKATAQVEPIGVGEVFIIAGQSYADGANDELEKVAEPQGRVVAYDVLKKTWRVAHDPQPNKAAGGTIWPAMGDLLA